MIEMLETIDIKWRSLIPKIDVYRRQALHSQFYWTNSPKSLKQWPIDIISACVIAQTKAIRYNFWFNIVDGCFYLLLFIGTKHFDDGKSKSYLINTMD